jgi:pimeloyl-ACP methyl ester carboxylesterase/DNA-binding CsgD family transcriptional regulator
MMSPPIQYATTSDGVRIAFMSLGSGPPMVFASNIFGELNGYRIGWPHYREVTDRLVALGWRVIRYDVRGMGSSDRDVDDLSLEGRVRDLEAVVSHLGLEGFALGGVDIGAATAISYAVSTHKALSALVLLTPWASGPRYLQIPQLRAAYSAEPMADDDSKLFASIMGSVATAFQDSDLVRLHTESFLQSTTAAGLAAYNAANARIDLTDLLPRVKVPTLVIHEPPFPFGSYELCREVAAGIPGARFVIVTDNSLAGRVHDANVTAINEFLRSTATGTHVSDGPTTLLSTTHRLTARELQVLRLVAAGSTNKEIASALGVAVSTLERHLVNLYTKIGARGRADAIAYALRHRLDTPST